VEKNEKQITKQPLIVEQLENFSLISYNLINRIGTGKGSKIRLIIRHKLSGLKITVRRRTQIVKAKQP